MGTSVLGGTAVFSLARYTPDGVLDQSFGSGGTVRTADNELVAFDLAIQANGKIVASGMIAGDLVDGRDSGTSSIALARYSSDGQLDGTFGNGGTVVTSVESSSESAVAGVVAIQPDGRILASGGYDDYEHDFSPCALVRYEPNGRLDTSFGKGGKVLTRFGSSWDGCEALAVQSRQDGSIVFVGKVAGGGPDQSPDRLALARYSPNGQLDPSFGAAGKQ
jgi:uncharacterized delta-60 repeat protein